MNIVAFNHNELVGDRFSNAVISYDSVAGIQKKCAKMLFDFLLTIEKFAPNSILDIGTGTGYMPDVLLKKFNNAKYTLNDISGKMLEYCKKKFAHNKDFQYIHGDFDDIIFDFNDLVVSNFALQWSKFFFETLEKFVQKSKYFAFTALLDGTFEEWNNVLSANGLPSASNKYPPMSIFLEKIRSFKNTTTQTKIANFNVSYNTPKDFCIYLKKLGASYSGANISMPKLKKLLSQQYKIRTKYRVMFCIIKKQ